MDKINKAIEYAKKHPEGFGMDIGNGYSFFITRMLNGRHRLGILDKRDNLIVFKTNVAKNDRFNAIKEMMEVER